MSENAQDGQSQQTQGQQDVATAQGQSNASQNQGVAALPEWAQQKMAEYRAEAQRERLAKEALEAEKKQRHESELAEQGKWKELADQRESALTARERELQTARMENAVIAAAAKVGFVDPAEAWALVDRAKIVYQDGKIAGADDVVGELAKVKPHLLKAQTPTAPTLPDHNPAGTSGRPEVSQYVRDLVKQQFQTNSGISGSGFSITSERE